MSWKLSRLAALAAIASGVLASDAGVGHANEIECANANTLTWHPSAYKYITRAKLQVWPIGEMGPSQIADALRAHVKPAYRRIGAPTFLKDLLFPSTAPDSFEGWIAAGSNLREDGSVWPGKWFFVPNPEYLGGYNPASAESSGYNASVARWFYQADWWKCRDGGAVAIGWYAHPGLSLEDFGDNGAAKLKTITAKDKYLTQILDLNAAEHLQWLIAIRDAAKRHADVRYGYSDEAHDSLALYFHWPTGETTNTLHLHTRINYPLSPVEYNRSVMLDDLIRFFSENPGKDGADFLAARMYKAKGLITNHITEHEPVLYAAFKTAFGEPKEADNPYKKIHEVIPFISGQVTVGEMQMAPQANALPSYVRYGQVALEAKFDASIEFSNPITGAKKHFLAEPSTLLTDLKLTDIVLQGKTVREVLACIRPYFDGKSAVRCLEWDSGSGSLKIKAP